MIALFPTILAVLLGLSFEEFYAETAMPEEPLWKLLFALPLVLLPIAFAEALFVFARHRFNRGRPFECRRYARWVRAAPLPLYAVALFGFGWAKVVVPLGIEGTVLIDHLVVLLPFFVALVGAELESARLKRPFRLTPEGPMPVSVREARGQLVDLFRQLSIVLLPLFGLILALDVVQDTALRIYFDELPLLSGLALIVMVLVLAIVYPLLFRVALGLKPLMQGAPLRKRLEDWSRRHDFRCRDVLFWATSRPIPNAAIIGMLPRFRYVVLTEELCRRLDLDEICAVFAHEVGHAKRHHVLWYLLFSLSFLVLLVPLGAWLGAAVHEASGGKVDPTIVTTLGVYLPGMAIFWFALFGFLSRRFELEADVFGVEAMGDASLFIETLEKVARVGRIERFRSARQHFSIAGRSDFLRRAFQWGEETLLVEFRGRMLRLRRVILTTAAVVLGGGLLWLGFDSLRGLGALRLEHGRPQAAAGVLRVVRAIAPGDAVTKTLLAEADLARGDADAAAESWRTVEDALDDLDPAGREAVLLRLWQGWVRALRQQRLEDARVQILRARRANHFESAGEARVHDPELSLVLDEMERLTVAIRDQDRAFLGLVLDHPPRWLRRADTRAVLGLLEIAAEDPKSL